MIGHFALLQLIFVVGIHGSPVRNNILEEIMQEMNDPNLNPGFDFPAFLKDQLDSLNQYRQFYGVPKMTEDCTLRTHAQDYAEVLASENGVGVEDLIHCADKDGCDPHGEGENLAMAKGSIYAETNATKAWYDEVWFYDFCSKDTGLKRPGHSGEMIGHFTQIVWKGSIKVGIGYARNAAKDKVFVVARYSPPGNVQGTDQYKENVLKPSYILDTYQDNCNAIQGGYAAWSAPGECTQSCGGGIKLQTRACTNPKPSLNGADCDGKPAQLAIQEWCNIETCPGDKSHLDLQCEERGKTAKGTAFVSNPCTLFCHISGNTYYPTGTVDDGTHCKAKRPGTEETYTGACVQNACIEMPEYVMPTTIAPTNPAGQVTGVYTDTPTAGWWQNIFFDVPNGASSITITNHKTNSVEIYVGYFYIESNTRYLNAVWREQWTANSGNVLGVSFTRSRSGDTSTINIPGPVQPNMSGHTIVLYAASLDEGVTAADISWSYSP